MAVSEEGVHKKIGCEVQLQITAGSHVQESRITS